MKREFAALLLILSQGTALAAVHRCSVDAADRAKKLLMFHLDQQEVSRMGFDSPTTAAPIKNPANPRQRFEVLEVVGYLQPHGEYRMRFIYYLLPSGCLLMGEEILERATL